MKKALLVLLLSYQCLPAGGQVLIAVLFGEKLNTGKIEFGITVNPAFTNITNIESKYKPGLNLGIYFNIRPDKKLFFHIEGIAKGTNGAKELPPYPTGNEQLDSMFTGGHVLRKIKGFSMPMLARYAISKTFFAELGIQPGLVLKAEDIFTSKVNDNELEYTINVTDRFTNLDFGIAGGLFLKFRNDRRSMGMGLRYVHGLVDIDKHLTGTQSNIAWQLIITIPVGADPKPKATTKSPETSTGKYP